MLLKRQKQKSFIDFVSSKLLLGPHEPRLAFKKVRACMKVVSQKKVIVHDGFGPYLNHTSLYVKTGLPSIDLHLIFEKSSLKTQV